MNKLPLALLALVLAGCNPVTIREANLRAYDIQRPVSAGERQQILASMRQSFFDPASVQGAVISNAVTTTGINETQSVNVCVIANAKNRMGAYTGRQGIHYVWEGGSMRTQDGSDWCHHPKLTFAPFPEAERLPR